MVGTRPYQRKESPTGLQAEDHRTENPVEAAGPVVGHASPFYILAGSQDIEGRNQNEMTGGYENMRRLRVDAEVVRMRVVDRTMVLFAVVVRICARVVPGRRRLIGRTGHIGAFGFVGAEYQQEYSAESHEGSRNAKA